ncbi:MAG: hypothetical protein R2834_10485 [Rhodothermales bacterium]
MKRWMFVVAALACTPLVAPAQQRHCGVLVMAHGGAPDWNAAVETAVAPLRARQPVSLAFGMADPATLRAAVQELGDAGVPCIAVVRLFMSGASFLHQTEYLLGLRPDPPAFFMNHGAPGGHSSHAAPPPIAVDAEVLLGLEGLLDDLSMGAILARRAASLSVDPASESILILAHGPGDDGENERWLHQMDRMADSIRATRPFHRVEVHTLREDWQDKRAASEARIRSFVKQETAAGRHVLVVPFRLSGFGPYAEVLEGLTYTADERGLLPDPAITDWMRRQAASLQGHAPDYQAEIR